MDVSRNAGPASEMDQCPRGLGLDYVEHPMLIDVVEVADKTEERRKIRVRSIVRLQPLDFFLGCSAEAPEATFNGIGPVLRISNGRELDVIAFGRGILPAIPDSQGVDGMVESRSQIVNAVPGNHAPSVERRWFDDIKNNVVTPRFSVELSGENVRVSVDPGLPFDGIEFGMFFCAAEFDEATGELRSGHASSYLT